MTIEKAQKIFELEEDATVKEIKKAWRRLVHIHHPDKGGNEEEFKKIKMAYGVLLRSIGDKQALAEARSLDKMYNASADMEDGVEIIDRITVIPGRDEIYHPHRGRVYTKTGGVDGSFEFHDNALDEGYEEKKL